MADYTADLRGLIRGLSPEETLGAEWTERLPRAGSFGRHTLLEFAFIPIGTGALVNGDWVTGIIAVPRTEIWEVFAIGLEVQSDVDAIFSSVRVALESPPVAKWVRPAEEWREPPGAFLAGWESLAITRPKFFRDTKSFSTYDEASETDPGSGIRRRILYSRSIIKASMQLQTACEVAVFTLVIDCVRYPSTERLLEMLDAGEVTERELFANLALRFPSPPEAS